MIDKETINKLMRNSESQKQTFDALMKKYKLLENTFEELLKQHIVLSELRDFYRNRAGLKNK